MLKYSLLSQDLGLWNIPSSSPENRIPGVCGSLSVSERIHCQYAEWNHISCGIKLILREKALQKHRESTVETQFDGMVLIKLRFPRI